VRLLVIAHDHVSPTGPVGERFVEHGYDVDTHLVVDEAHHHAPTVTTVFPDPLEYDAVVAMGAPWSTYDDALVGTWVRPELDLLHTADREGVPVLGICFGGQLLATAHGGSVQRSSTPEIGWTAITTDEPDLVPDGPWFQWHYDRWSLPPGARELARNEAASQAFTLRRNLAVQFHPELTSTMLDGWLANGGADAATAYGHDLDELRAQTRATDAAARLRAHALVDGFLTHVA
jgi:GMP synthase-like glutamine amidotransferase